MSNVHKRSLSVVFTVAVLCLWTSFAQAASIVLSPSAVNANPGDSLSITVNAVGFPAISYYGFTVNFDDIELNVSTAWTDSTGMTPFVLSPTVTDPNNGSGGKIKNVSYGSFTTFPSGNFTLGTVSFLVNNPVTDAFKDIWIDFSNVLNDNILGDFGQDITTSINVSGATATVNANAVPEPASILLLGSGLAGLVALGRKKKN